MYNLKRPGVRRIFSILLIISFTAFDVARANSSELLGSSETTTLAPELRLNPFISEHLKTFQDRVALMNAIGELRNLIMAGKAREGPVVRLNNELCKKLNNEAIEIQRTIKNKELTSGKKYAIVVFDFKKEHQKIKVLFLKDYNGSSSFTDKDREELKESFGIKNDIDIGHLDSPGLLHGVWFVNPNVPKTSMDKTTKICNQTEIERLYKLGRVRVARGYSGKDEDFVHNVQNLPEDITSDNAVRIVNALNFLQQKSLPYIAIPGFNIEIYDYLDQVQNYDYKVCLIFPEAGLKLFSGDQTDILGQVVHIDTAHQKIYLMEPVVNHLTIIELAGLLDYALTRMFLEIEASKKDLFLGEDLRQNILRMARYRINYALSLDTLEATVREIILGKSPTPARLKQLGILKDENRVYPSIIDSEGKRENPLWIEKYFKDPQRFVAEEEALNIACRRILYHGTYEGCARLAAENGKFTGVETSTYFWTAKRWGSMSAEERDGASRSEWDDHISNITETFEEIQHRLGLIPIGFGGIVFRVLANTNNSVEFSVKYDPPKGQVTEPRIGFSLNEIADSTKWDLVYRWKVINSKKPWMDTSWERIFDLSPEKICHLAVSASEMIGDNSKSYTPVPQPPVATGLTVPINNALISKEGALDISLLEQYLDDVAEDLGRKVGSPIAIKLAGGIRHHSSGARHDIDANLIIEGMPYENIRIEDFLSSLNEVLKRDYDTGASVRISEEKSDRQMMKKFEMTFSNGVDKRLEFFMHSSWESVAHWILQSMKNRLNDIENPIIRLKGLIAAEYYLGNLEEKARRTAVLKMDDWKGNVIPREWEKRIGSFQAEIKQSEILPQERKELMARIIDRIKQPIRAPPSSVPAKDIGTLPTKNVRVMLINLVNPEEGRRQGPFACYVLAGHLRITTGVETSIVDMDKEYKECYRGLLSFNEVKRRQESFRRVINTTVEKIKDMKPHVLGLSMKWGNLQATDLLLAELNKEIGSSMPLVVMGNTLATFASDELLERYRNSGSLIVLGEGEAALEEIVQKVSENIASFRNPSIYSGLPNVKTHVGEKVKRQDLDISSYSLPDEEYMKEYFNEERSFAIESSRGCPWSNCTFCSIRELCANKNWRHFPVEEILKRIRQLIEANQRLHNTDAVSIYFIDSEFFGPMDDEHFDSTMDHIETLARGIARLKEKFGTKDNEALKISIIGARVDSVYKGALKDESKTEREKRFLQNERRKVVYQLLRSIGVPRIYLGIESGSPSQLKRYGKGITVEENEEALKILKDMGFETEIGFIFFDPLATIEGLRENIQFLERTGFHKSGDRVLGSLRVQAGSPMVKILRNKKLLKGDIDLSTISYNVNYANADVADIEARFSQWEKQTRDILNYMLGLKGGFKRGEGPIQKMRRDIRELDFRFVKALVMANSAEERNEKMLLFLGEMKNKLKEIESLVENGNISDSAGILLKVLLPKAYNLNNEMRLALSSDSILVNEMRSHLPEIIERKRPHINQVIQFANDFYVHNFDALYLTFPFEAKVDKNKYTDVLEKLYGIYANLSRESKEILKVATIFHDIGAVTDGKSWNHNIVGSLKVKKILEKFGYGNDFIEKVSKIIFYHGFYPNIGVDFLPKDLKDLTESEKDVLLLLNVFDGSSRKEGNRLTPEKIEQIMELRIHKVAEFAKKGDIYKYRFGNMLVPSVFTIKAERDKNEEIIINMLAENGQLTEALIDNWNNRIKIYAFGLFKSPIKESCGYFVKMITGIQKNIEQFEAKGKAAPSDIIVDTDIDFMELSSDKQKPYLQKLQEMIESGKDIPVSYVLQNETLMITIELNRLLDIAERYEKTHDLLAESPNATTAEQLTAQNEADRIHTENLKYTPNIPQNTILCHVIMDSILPEGQRDILKTLEQNMRGGEYGEKVVSLSIKEPDKFIEELSTLMAKQKDLYKGYAIQFDVACSNTTLVNMILESNLGAKALAFEPYKESEVDVVQIEGIMLALRALNSGKIENLQEAFKILTGKELSQELSSITDINEFIKRITFVLPTAKLINYNHIRQLNEIIRKNIESAA